MVSVFLVFVFGFAVWKLFLKDREFSEMENRNLRQFPELSWSSIKNGTFTLEFEKYFDDQLPLKDELVTLKTDADRLLMHDLQNGVYFGKDGYYLQDYKQNDKQIETNVGYINEFLDFCPDTNISFMLVPNSISVMSDKLPSAAATEDQNKTIEKVRDSLDKRIKFYCPMDELKTAVSDGTQAYYKTDHHWTSDGARAAFDGFMKFLGEEPLKAEYSCREINDFLGTLYSKAPSNFTEKDTMKFYTDKNNSLSVNYTFTDKTTDTLFDSSFEDKKDKYSTYLGGNFPLVEIKSSGAQQNKKVLILKDSYANCAMPYFTSMYSDVSVIDLRYYHDPSKPTVSQYVKQNNIDEVILLYNVDFLNSDNNFTSLM